MDDPTVVDRLAHKSRDGQFLWELENDFELSPRESQLILETAHLYFSGGTEAAGGRVSLWVVSKDAGAGRSLEELPKIQVWVTLDAGKEDLETYALYGHIGLRRQKLLRISEEVLEQGGVCTQEDLARLLGTSVRTIRRDIAYLRTQHLRVMTRGVYSDIGPSVSHKVVIVEMALKGFVYTVISRQTGHSPKAIKRYVNSFIRVVALWGRGIKEPAELSHYVGLSERLVAEYLELYFKVREKFEDKIQEMLKQLSSRPDYAGADPTGMKKGVKDGGI